MIRQTITLGDYRYLVDLYKAQKDFAETYKSKFVMLRDIDNTTGQLRDKDLYVFPEELLSTPEKIIYPCVSSSFVQFSTSVDKYSDNLTNDKLPSSTIRFYDATLGDDGVVSISEKLITCDKIRVYHPHTIKRVNGIIYVDTYLNDIHIHLLASDLSSGTTGSENEIQLDNIYYSEYLEFLIPSIEELLGGSTFYNERSFVVKDSTDKHPIYSPANQPAEAVNNSQYVDFSIIRSPYVSAREDNCLVRTYYTEDISIIKENYVRYPLNIGIYPYSELSEGVYLYSDKLDPKVSQYVDDCRITMRSRLGFSGGVVSILNEFDYPEKEKFSSFADAYQFYNGVDLHDYIGIKTDETENDSDYKEEDSIEQQCSFVLDIYTDLKMKTSLYHESMDIENPAEDLDEIGWNIFGIMESWNDFNDMMVARCKFIDRYLGKVIYGNPVVITKEWFKYIVGDISNPDRRAKINGEQERTKRISEMDISKFNFIDKIQCTVVSAQNDTPTTSGSKQISRTLYKPIFFRTHDLQNVKLVQGLRQNIGINLSEYMTKVDTFKMVINGVQFIETGRNDVYVIFNVDASALDFANGTYHILDQDDEYISSGNWTTII